MNIFLIILIIYLLVVWALSWISILYGWYLVDGSLAANFVWIIVLFQKIFKKVVDK